MANSISGSVIDIDSNGDLITDISTSKLGGAPRDERLRIIVDDEHETLGLFPPDHGQPSMTLIAVESSDSSIRLHLVDDSATMMLGVRKGASVTLKW
jgi:S-adenosyl-L-methionine hydrolase (adenosine-forming)